MDENPLYSQLRLCTYNIFAWRTAQYKDNDLLVASFFKRIDADVHSLNEVIAPGQPWFHFLRTLEQNYAQLEKDTEEKTSTEPKDASASSSEPATASTSESTETSEKQHTEGEAKDDAPDFTAYGDGKSIPDAPMIEYMKVIKKYRDEGLLTERDLGTLRRVRFFAGNAFSKSILDSGLSNALIVNTRAGKVFSKSHTFEFKNQLLRVPGIETRGACHVRLVHPTVGAMEIYSLHLDHMWEKNRHKQIDLLMQQIWSTSALETANKNLIESGSSSPAISLHTPPRPDVETLPHIIMGDFNAITKSDYTEDFEEEHITKVREAGRWEPPTYSLMEKMKALGYVDLWRRTHPEDTDRDHEVTTCAYNTRIDYIFLSPALVSMVDWTHENTYSHILNGVHHSDHFPVLGNLQFLKK